LVGGFAPGDAGRYVATPTMMEQVTTNKLSDEQHRPLLFSQVRHFVDIAALNLPKGKHFGLFLACDATHVSNDLIEDTADQLLSSGMVYIHAYGPDSDRLLLRFDTQIIRRHPNETAEDVILTTGARWPSLDSALFDFLFVGFPAIAYEATCGYELVVCVGMARQGRRLRVMLQNQSPLRRRQLRKPGR